MLNMYLHNKNSRGGRALAKAMNIKCIKHDGSRYIGGRLKKVINWGAARLPDEAYKGKVINKPPFVASAQNKLEAFVLMDAFEVSIPPYTQDTGRAAEWIKNDGAAVVCRTLLRGSAGAGITIASNVLDLVRAPLYTKYIKKVDEYRVHVLNGAVIDVQKKAKRRDFDNDRVDYQVRTHANGFIYMREGIEPPVQAIDQSIKAVAALSLDFGAVDVIWNGFESEAYVLEVNTAPGLEGTTLENYAEAFRCYFLLDK